MATQEYEEFSKRFPEHSWDVINDYDRFGFEAVSYNPNTQNSLVLSLNYEFRNGEIYERIHCDAMHRFSGERYDAEKQIVLPFIKTTKCLDDAEEKEH